MESRNSFSSYRRGSTDAGLRSNFEPSTSVDCLVESPRHQAQAESVHTESATVSSQHYMTPRDDESQQPIKDSSPVWLRALSTSKFFGNIFNRGDGRESQLPEDLYDHIDRPRPLKKPDYDPYQLHFPPKIFPAPKQSWYNIPTKDDGSNSWPFSEIWPAEYFVDIRKHLPVFAVMFILTGLPVCLVQRYMYPKTQHGGNRPWYDCMHSGDFNLQGIDVTFGRMTFAEAKAIDVAWNALVGRGVQIFLTMISCKVFYAALLYVCERHPITYELYSAVSLTPTTYIGLRPMLKSIIVNKTLKVRLIIVWLLISTIYLAILPMLFDAVSGYKATQLTMLRLANGTRLDVSDSLTTNAYQQIERNQPPPYLNTNTTTDYRQEYGADFALKINSTTVYFWGQYSIDNISTVYSSSCINSTTSAVFLSDDHYTYFTPASLTTFEDPSCQNWYPLAPVIAADAHALWNSTYLKDPVNYDCVSKDIYTWGFSYELFLIYSSISAVWILCTWILYVYTSVHSELLQKGRGFGPWRALLDLSEALKSQVEDANTCAYSEIELRDNVRDRNMVTYTTLNKKGETAAFGLREICDGECHARRLKLDWDREYG